jgi:hypothetical protein
MIRLTGEIEVLAERLAAAQHISVEAAIRQALEQQARVSGVSVAPRRRLSIGETLAVGAEVAAMPLLDQRNPDEIIADLDAE